LDNLFYYYGRDHLRNDAFLLRSDGGGFEIPEDKGGELVAAVDAEVEDG